MKRMTIIMLLLTCFALQGYAQDQQETGKKLPTASYQVGSSQVVVWENEGNGGVIWKNFKIERRYQKNGEWHSSSYFNERELLELRAALDKVINEQIVGVRHPNEEK